MGRAWYCVRWTACPVLALLVMVASADAQTFTYRGFLEGRGLLFPQEASNDDRNLVGDFTARGEAFAEPAEWLMLAAGVDIRVNTHSHVGDDWTPDLADRPLDRPPLSVRRLAASIYRGPLTFDAGRQFIRWGRSDILVPTDRFAPRDYLNVIDSDFLAVNAGRLRFSNGFDSLDVVWVPVFTPSRIPLLDQRWTVLPAGAVPLVLDESTDDLPERWQGGVRWERVGGGYEFALAFFDGFSHLPAIEPAVVAGGPAPAAGVAPPAFVPVRRRFPEQRMYGADGALPTRWFTLKAEAGYFQSRDQTTDDFVLYVIQMERQSGEWLFIGGYAGESVTTARQGRLFAPDRGIAKSILGSATYTVDATRTLALEGALRQDGDGVYAEAEYSQSSGQHWRTTVTAAIIAGDESDFLGQFRRNSHLTASVRFSF